MITGHTTLRISRAEYEAKWGVKPTDGSIGARIYNGEEIYCEFLFLNAMEEILFLEALYAL